MQGGHRFCCWLSPHQPHQLVVWDVVEVSSDVYVYDVALDLAQGVFATASRPMQGCN